MAPLPGVHRVRTKLASGCGEYWYAWRGGPRILSESAATPAALALKVNKAAVKAAAEYYRIKAEKPNANGFLAGLIYAWQASPQFKMLGERTAKDLRKHLSVIRDDLGDMPIKALPAARADILEWRDQYAAHPRTADHYMSALAGLLSWARDQGLTTADPIAKWPRLYRVDRSEIVWTAGEIEAVCAKAEPELARAILLAAWTGLRQGDLLKLAWADIQGDFIIRRTAKRGRVVRIPITPLAREALDACPKVSPLVLTKDGKPWKLSTLNKRFGIARRAAKVTGKRWHDLRGNFATMLVLAGVDTAGIAEVMGWAPDRADDIRRSYVGQGSVASIAHEKLKRFTGGK
jgi:integrase